jgi:hypothetical protein
MLEAVVNEVSGDEVEVDKVNSLNSSDLSMCPLREHRRVGFPAGASSHSMLWM